MKWFKYGFEVFLHKSSRLVDVICLLFIASVLTIALYRLFLPQLQFVSTPDFGQIDSLHMSISTKYFLWDKLQHNELPLWSKQIGSGYPVLGEGQIGTFFIPNILLYRLFDFAFAYNASLLLAILLFGLGMYVWLRSVSFSPAASVFGALTMTFSGIIFTHLTHITLLQSLSLTPLIIWLAYRLWQKPSYLNAVLFGFVLSQQLLAGFVQATFITVIFVIAHTVWLSWNKPQKISRTFFFGVAFLIFVGSSAIQLVPSREFLQNTPDPNGFSLGTATAFSFPLKHIIGFIEPFWFGNPRLGTYPAFTEFDGSIFWENTGYIGLVPLLLILVAFYFERKFSPRHPLFFFIVLLGGSFLFMTGSHSPLYFLYSYWPLNLFRVPSRFIWLFTLSLVYMSVYGFERLLRSKYSQTVKLIVVSLCIANSIHLFAMWNTYNAFLPSTTWLSEPKLAADVGDAQRIMTLGAPQIHNETFLSTGWQSLEPYLFLKNSVQPNSNLLWHIPHVNASMGRPLRRDAFVKELFQSEMIVSPEAASLSAVAADMFGTLGVDHVIAPELTIADHKQVPRTSVSEGDFALGVYDLKHRPRVYLAHQGVLADTLFQAEAFLKAPGFHEDQSVVIEEKLDFASPSAQAKTAIVTDSDTETTIQVLNNENQALLVLADTLYPGWNAYVDSVRTKIMPVNVTQRGVLVPAGDHTVVFRYEPESFQIGWKISAASLFIVIVFLFALRTPFFKNKNAFGLRVIRDRLKSV